MSRTERALTVLVVLAGFMLLIYRITHPDTAAGWR